MTKFKFSNIYKHFILVTKHRLKVFQLCCRAGIPWRGFVHDLSKYSFSEFWESVKYYNGDHSPLKNSKEINGFSKAWLHHKGRNKHHFEYWIDLYAPVSEPIIPYKYTVEMICDDLASGLTYQGKKWYPSYQLEYFNKRKDKIMMNDKIKKILEEAFQQVIDEGINKVINKNNLKRIYYKYIDDNNIK